MAGPVAIVAAMQEELGALLAAMPDEQRVRVAGRDFWVGHLHGHAVVAVLSRIGKVAAATTATVLLERFGVRAIVFTGVAGGLAPGVRVGDVVVATKLLQHDLDASPIFPRYEVPLTGHARFAADTAISDALAAVVAGVLSDPVALLGRTVVDDFGLQAPRLHRGLLVSGDRFVSTRRRKRSAQARVARGARGRNGRRRGGAGVPRLPRALRRSAHDLGPCRRCGACRFPALRGRRREPLQPRGDRRLARGAARRCGYLSQPRRRKYHIGTSALATISTTAYA
jgi:5'-methylthioadenosine/S-adenosylhomocysteine nucleosidase